MNWVVSLENVLEQASHGIGGKGFALTFLERNYGTHRLESAIFFSQNRSLNTFTLPFRMQFPAADEALLYRQDIGWMLTEA